MKCEHVCVCRGGKVFYKDMQRPVFSIKTGLMSSKSIQHQKPVFCELAKDCISQTKC